MASSYNSSSLHVSDEALSLAIAGFSQLHQRLDPSANLTNSVNQTNEVFHKNLTTPSSSSPSTSIPLQTYSSGSDSSIIAKITLLLVVTAVLLIASYKFVVRLFLGYADRKDDVFQDEFSEDEDSAVVKRISSSPTEVGWTIG